MWQCSQKHENREEAKFCAKCGEKRVVEKRCPQCAALLEPDDLFCVSCGHRLEAAPQPVAPAPVAAPTPAPAPAPAPVEPPPVAVAQTPAPPVEDEPVTFSFGGAKIAMKEPGKPDKVKPPKRASGMSPTLSAILSFVAMAAVLYFAYRSITQ